MNTLIIPFSASNVNLRSTPHVVGAPSSTAIAGFGHALCLLIGEALGFEIKEQGTALALNRYSLSPGRQKHVIGLKTNKHPDKARQGDLAPMVDERLGNLTGALLVRFEASSVDTHAMASALSGIKDLVHLLRLAGGHLRVTHKLGLFTDDDGQDAFRSLPGYYRVVVDRTPWITSYSQAKGVDHLESLLGLLLASEGQMRSFSQVVDHDPAAPDAEASESDADDLDEFELASNALAADFDPNKIYLGRLIPMDIGHRLIEMPTKRNTGMPYLHAYAEPVLGVARLQALSSYRKSKEGFSAFWVHHAEANTYLALGAN